eukprot:CAMPEP_0114972316 /NCGR_PEP_ID=MMETSP0216-20121206/327_1 /TAXON_ID=223996 /ORGANISM="Protocruzia adherens, Strain Boccale" /LENGTH=59 /DNA_ID=CAMNT_0002332675 /DNA_START=446 /DNA_END=625 /DNA_ORIENTATION=+
MNQGCNQFGGQPQFYGPQFGDPQYQNNGGFVDNNNQGAFMNAQPVNGNGGGGNFVPAQV